MLPLLLFAVACRQKPQGPSMQEKIHTGLTQFFTADQDPGRKVVGLWVADKKSITTLMEKKYLAGYKAQPDEKSAAELRERLAHLDMYFRIGANGTYQSMTIVKDSVGMNLGRMKSLKVTKTLEEYDATIKGKNETKARIQVVKSGDNEKFIYIEGEDRIEAVREKTPSAELVARYEKQLSAATGLAQY